MTTAECLRALEKSAAFAALSDGEQVQLLGLLVDHGQLGAIKYLQPLNWSSDGRDQAMADRHRAVLENLNYTW